MRSTKAGRRRSFLWTGKAAFSFTHGRTHRQSRQMSRCCFGRTQGAGRPPSFCTSGRLWRRCLQAAYTRREKLPVAGLYREDRGASPEGFQIRPLTAEHRDLVRSVYRTVDEDGYVRERIASNAMFGAFFGDVLAGFIGVHSEGSIGMLEVLPQHRRKKIGTALETWLCNRFIERGMIPYGQIAVGNEASFLLQERLQLCFSKETVFWMSREKAGAEM